MNPTTPTNPGPAMPEGAPFIRPNAVGLGPWDGPKPAAGCPTPAAIEHALAAAVKDP